MKTVSRSATRVLIIVTLFFVCSLTALGWLWFALAANGAVYEEYLQVAATTREQDVAAQELMRLVDRTVEERAIVNSYFLDVVDIAVFLEQIEQYAIQNQILLSSDQLESLSGSESDTVTRVRIPLSMEGERESVLDMVRLLEKVPYHGYVEQLQTRLAQSNPEQITARAVLVLSYKQHD